MNVIKLFDYQEDMKERIEKALRLHRSVMAQMPTEGVAPSSVRNGTNANWYG